MKYRILLLLLLFGVPVYATQWGSYPTTNGFAVTDTLLMGNGSTNLTITFGPLAATLPITNAATAIANTSSNNIYNLTGTNLVMFTNGPPTAGQALVIVGTNTYGAVLTKGTNWPSGGGSQTPILQDVDYAGFNATNIGVLSTTTLSATTLWATNMLTPTNGAFAGTVIDLSKSENGTTNLGGNLTFTGVANITAGSVNSSIVTLNAGASTRTIDVNDASMHKETNWNTTLPAGWMMEVMVRVYPGLRTNFYQKIIP